jgi:phytanoyl-CoA hydroxylase
MRNGCPITCSIPGRVSPNRRGAWISNAVSDPNQLIREFAATGFVAVRGFLAPPELTKLRDELEHYQRVVLPRLPHDAVLYEVKGQPATLKQMPLLGDHCLYFGHLLNGNRFRQLAELLLGGPVVPKQVQWLNKSARLGAATPPHQDGYYYMIEPPEAVAMWLALDEADEANGCMRYLPGSHRHGMRTHGRMNTLGFSLGITDFGDTDHAAEVALPAQPGDLLVHHCLTIHRADANPSQRERRALQFVYFSARAREDQERKAEYQGRLKRELAAAGRI